MTRLQKWLRGAGILIALGLSLELVSLFWRHPLSFLLFVFLGGGPLGTGVVLYLYALVSVREQESEAPVKG